MVRSWEPKVVLMGYVLVGNPVGVCGQQRQKGAYLSGRSLDGEPMERGEPGNIGGYFQAKNQCSNMNSTNIY